jgi:capsular polysaccharide export protein
LGNFFNQLTRALKEDGHNVYRIHFNAGDRYYSQGAKSRNYTGTLENWSTYLGHYLKKHQIDTIILYGDCRPYHKIAIALAKESGIRCKVLEEGYLRPDWITCENFGVNAYSSFQFDSNKYPDNAEISKEEKIDRTGNTFFQRFWFASIYFWAMWAGRKSFPNYSHHINASPIRQGRWWLTNFYRKFFYKVKDKKTLRFIRKNKHIPCFLVPLQVATDSQIREHSPFNDIESFIYHILVSFKAHATEDSILIIKHHPVDRGHSQYSKFIRSSTQQLDIKQPVIYGHDWPLPELLRQVKGVITLNSTVGISALIHKLPVKVLGKAFWNQTGITDQSPLDNFWQTPSLPDENLLDRYIYGLAKETQIKGSFYKKNTSTAKAIANSTLNCTISSKVKSSPKQRLIESHEVV